MILSRPPLSGVIGPSTVPAPQVEYDGRNLTGNTGDDITTWVDSSGNGRNATGTAGGVPKVQLSGLNGNPVSRWDGGAGDKLNFSSAPVATSFTCIAVMKCTDGGTRTLLAEGTGGDGPPRFYIDANKISLSEDDNVTVTASTTLSTSTFYTVAVTYNSATNGYVFYVNGSSDGSGTSAITFTRAFARVGCRSGNQNTFLGDIAYDAFWNTVLTSGQLTAKFAQLQAIWGHY